MLNLVGEGDNPLHLNQSNPSSSRHQQRGSGWTRRSLPGLSSGGQRGTPDLEQRNNQAVDRGHAQELKNKQSDNESWRELGSTSGVTLQFGGGEVARPNMVRLLELKRTRGCPVFGFDSTLQGCLLPTNPRVHQETLEF